MSTQRPTDWKRLAEAVKTRRVELGLRQADVATRGGPSEWAILQIEGARKTTYRDLTLRQLEEALGWEPGSTRAVLAGGDPTVATPAAPRPDAYDLQRLVLDRLVALDLSFRQAAERTDGRMSQGDLRAIALGAITTLAPGEADALAVALEVPVAQVNEAIANARGDTVTKLATANPADLPPAIARGVLELIDRELEKRLPKQ